MVKKWLIYLLLFLLTANIALVVSLLVKTSKAEDKKIVLKKERFESRRKGFEEHLINELKFNDRQQKELSDFSKEFHEQRKNTKIQIHQLRKEYFDQLAMESPDTARLNDLAYEIGILETDRIKQDYKHYHKVRSICTEEQAMKFDSLGRSHMKKHMNKYGQKKYRRHSDSEKANNDNN